MKKLFQKTLWCFGWIGIWLIITAAAHPYHVGSVEIRENPNTFRLEITGKFFHDDFEDALSTHAKSRVKLTDQNINTPEIKKLIADYISHSFSVQNENKMITLHYLGAEIERESVLIYVESQPVRPSVLRIQCTFLYSIFSDQLNIIHLIRNEKRKSFKLMYPDKTLQY